MPAGWKSPPQNKLTPAQAEKLRQLHKQGVPRAALATRYGISTRAVNEYARAAPKAADY
jgi:DNA invertase Pin-like site-specific DNA recombinase